ncbi:MAG: SHOCT domain-containing protein [Candidatus Eisenbacteria bacterium]|uniref:SHOCT domain-containing protein n=1 Tax=Eiseniibacteriota bacterium TaxID=2212470 RepID=A0A849SLL0_UNCEI|nr:SHOCT domain-containing protein [Candidatus Eisenbacteria bacterium]
MTSTGVPEVDTSESPSVRAAVEQLQKLLVEGERLEAWAVQRRVFALTHRRTVVGASSGRLVVLTRGLFAGFRHEDVRWQDLKDVRLQVGVFGADLIVQSLSSTDLAVGGEATPTLRLTGLRKEQAQAVYRICQANEQAWREKRRIRELEEMRARSGGIQLGPGQEFGSGAAAGGDHDPVARLERARAMLAKGLISDSEFEAIKARVVSGL